MSAPLVPERFSRELAGIRASGPAIAAIRMAVARPYQTPIRPLPAHAGDGGERGC